MPHFTKREVLAKFLHTPIIPVFYNSLPEVTQSALLSCYQGGLRVFEFTDRGENSKQVFKEAYTFVRKYCPEMALGIGTIFNAEQAQTFLDLGADFLVQPVISKDVAEVCHQNQILWAPGAGTINEVYLSSLYGAELVKLFPGNVLGPGFVKSLKGPLPNVKVMVTGGVEPNAESLNIWFKAGVSCVGIGSQLFPKDILQFGKLKQLSSKIHFLLESIEAFIPSTLNSD